MNDRHVHSWTGATYREVMPWCPECDTSEVEWLRTRVATLEDGIRWEIVSTWDEKSADRLRALLDASHDQDDGCLDEIAAAGLYDQDAEEADR